MSIADKFEVIADAVYNKGVADATLPNVDDVKLPNDEITGLVVTDARYYNDIAKMLAQVIGDGKTCFPSEMSYRVELAGAKGWDAGCEWGREQGRQAQYDEFWDDIQNNGEKCSYGRAFGGNRWTDTTFNPKYPIYASNAQACFHSNTYITRIPVVVDISELTTDINYVNQMFYNCSRLVTIPLKVSQETLYASNTFQSCSALENLTIDGTIGTTGFDVHWSTKLSYDSLLSILNACKKENAAVTVTLPKRCIDRTTVTETYIANDTELNTALTNATAKGYTVSFA